MSNLSAGSWDKLRPEIRVFDGAFIRDSVYSGAAVEASHRRNLLRFAVGDAAVSEVRREEAAAEKAKLLKEQIRVLTAGVAQHHVGVSLAEFRKLPAVADVEQAIAEVDRDLDANAKSASITARPLPELLSSATWNHQRLFSVLAKGLGGVGDDAEAKVRAHVGHFQEEGAEAWLQSGRRLEQDDRCPYCNQDIHGLPLIEAYRTYFDERYLALLGDVEEIGRDFQDLAEKFTARLAVDRDMQELRLNNWSDAGSVQKILLDTPLIDRLIVELRAVIEPLLGAKRAAPLSSIVEPATEAAVSKLWDDIERHLAEVNEVIASEIGRLEQFTAQLQVQDAEALRQKRKSLVRSQVRHNADVQAMMDDLEAKGQALKLAEAEKTDARDKARETMNATLVKYQDAINDLLTRFGAEFSIDQMTTSFMGAAQTEFVIKLRDAEVPLKHESGPNFDSALSEGDKRTLAFAFFAATILRDPAVATHIVVVDDPMSSMDAGRRHQTTEVVLEMEEAAKQLILCSHDAPFLRHYRSRSLRKDDNRAIAEIAIHDGPAGYSSWIQGSLDELCETEYLKMHRQVAEYLSVGLHEPVHIAKQLRPLLEGYLHRRFPQAIREGLLLGEAIAKIRSSAAPSPLHFAVSVVDEIEKINTYAGNFHHDTNPGYVAAPVSRKELRDFASRTMDVVHGKP
ncbi:AAA family ATPase [Pseudarthrobacter scleromae]|uniref:AAA family ATPase n=1 Tax=Pseudarthrobacter scleromae TaxID=158897 RepID=UPI0036287531